MIHEFGLEQVRRDDASVVTVGTFDGVHVGHQAILRYLIERAQAQHGRSVAVSFEPHPREVVHGEHVPLLTTVAERAALFEEVGLDRFIVIRFSPAFSQLSPEDFVADVLVRRIGLQEIVVGYDHAFGRGRTGDRALLERLGKVHGFSVDVIPAQVVERHVVSSTEIRKLLVEEGDVVLAAEMLGRYYGLTGTVVPGDGRGRRLGFPTANLVPQHARKVVPGRGVYAVRVSLPAEDRWRGAMMNIGHRPTFDGAKRQVEVHLFDFDGDLYGRELRVEFVDRVRDERRFDGAEALRRQLYQDRQRCKKLLEGVT